MLDVEASGWTDTYPVAVVGVSAANKELNGVGVVCPSRDKCAVHTNGARL